MKAIKLALWELFVDACIVLGVGVAGLCIFIMLKNSGYL